MTTKAAQLREKSARDLDKHVLKLRQRLASISRERYVKELKNVREIRASRRELARTLTLLTEVKEGE